MPLTTIQVSLEPEVCPRCGIVFGVEANYQRELKKGGKTFYCPNGHSQWYGESVVDKLKKELAQEAKRHEQEETRLKRQVDSERASKEYFERSRAAYKGQLTKTKKRVANGVCPCCNRSFQNLKRHMMGQHPDYIHEEARLEETVPPARATI